MALLKSKKRIVSNTKNNLVTYAMLIVLFAVAFIWLQSGTMPRKIQNLLVPLCIYSILAVSLNLVVGVLGDLSLGHAGFMCIGAYTGAVFTNVFQSVIPNDILRFLIALTVGGICAAIFGFLICIPVLRLKGDYLAIVTLAFGEIIKNIFNLIYMGIDSEGLKLSINGTAYNEMLLPDGKTIIKGAMGITGTSRDANFIIAFILLVVTVIASLNLINSRTGRAVMAIRDNSIAAQTIGINISKYKLIVFTFASFFAGIAGVLYSHNMNSFSSSGFDYNTSILILVYVVLGGIGSIRGSIISAMLLYALPELLRQVGEYRMLFYAILLIIMMIVNNNEKINDLKKEFFMKLKNKNKKTAEGGNN